MPSLAEFEADYWAPDREQVLAQMRAEQQPQAPPPSSYQAPSYWRDDNLHTTEYTPRQAEYDRFAQDYWSPDREQVLEGMRGGGWGGGGNWGLGIPGMPVGTGGGWGTPGMPVGGGYGGGQYQSGSGGGGVFDETALSQAWLSSGGRTPQDLARFLQQNPQLAQGITITGSKGDKLRLPDGRTVDAVLASGLGGRGAQWNVEGPGGGGGAAGGSYAFGERAPNPTPFNFAEFAGPNGLNFMNDPGYQARLKLGTDAIERGAAAKGTLLTGGTLKDLNQYAQDYASNEFGNVYNRALDAYRTNYQTRFEPWKEGYNQAYQSWAGNLGAANQGFQNNLMAQNQRYGQLMGAAQLGLQGTGQLAGYGQNTAGNYANILGNYGNQAGENITGRGNALAAGQAGSGQAWGNAIGNLGNYGSMAAMYGGLYGGQGNDPYNWSRNMPRTKL
jgi:hypothetical protein